MGEEEEDDGALGGRAVFNSSSSFVSRAYGSRRLWRLVSKSTSATPRSRPAAPCRRRPPLPPAAFLQPRPAAIVQPWRLQPWRLQPWRLQPWRPHGGARVQEVRGGDERAAELQPLLGRQRLHRGETLVRQQVGQQLLGLLRPPLQRLLPPQPLLPPLALLPRLPLRYGGLQLFAPAAEGVRTLFRLRLLDPHARGDVLLAQHALLLGHQAATRERPRVSRAGRTGLAGRAWRARWGEERGGLRWEVGDAQPGSGRARWGERALTASAVGGSAAGGRRRPPAASRLQSRATAARAPPCRAPVRARAPPPRRDRLVA